MAREVRNEAGTPPEIFGPLHRDFRFTVDACAVGHNAKLPAYLTPEDDALDADWSGERVWCNPPFRNIPAFLAHALEPVLAVYLLPVRSDRLWWMQWKPLAEVHWYVGQAPHRRIQYVPPPGVRYSSNPACECLMCFGERFRPGQERWRSGRTGELLPVLLGQKGNDDG